MTTLSVCAAGLLVVLALVVLIRTRSVAPAAIHLTPPNALVLEQMCRATHAMVGTGEPPEWVTVDLSALAAIDASTVGPLEYACATWAEAGAQVTLTGCRPAVVAALLRRGVRADIAARGTRPPSSRLH